MWLALQKSVVVNTAGGSVTKIGIVPTALHQTIPQTRPMESLAYRDWDPCRAYQNRELRRNRKLTRASSPAPISKALTNMSYIAERFIFGRPILSPAFNDTPGTIANIIYHPCRSVYTASGYWKAAHRSSWLNNPGPQSFFDLTLTMKFRIRGPSSQSVVNFSDTATVENLRKTIATETALTSFDIKHGYPPKTLHLDQYPASTLLCNLDVKLDGEQLTVGQRDTALAGEVTSQPQPANASTPNKPSSSMSASRDTESPQKPPTVMDKAEAPTSTSDFSFGKLGTAPTLPKPSAKPTPRPADVPPPASSSRKRKLDSEKTNDPPEVVLPERGGAVVLRVLPDDNSCLFRAVGRAVMPDLDAMAELRSVIADAIQADPVKYTRAILDDKEPDDYCAWIKRDDSWGGQIELDILSRQFDLEIFSIDTKTLRIDKYNVGRPKRCYVVYSLIHYDSIAFSFFDSPPEDDTMQFDASDNTILESAISLCQRLNEQGYYTDTAAIKIRCNECGIVVIGEKGAAEHAMQADHYDMQEVQV